MDLCSSGHEEVCYDVRNCPVCEKMEQIESLENVIDERDTLIDELKNELNTI